MALLYGGYYEPNYHADVFEDIRELFCITLSTNRKDVCGKDSRAVGISNFLSPFTVAEARQIVSRTKFVSESHGVWSIEVKSLTHAGTLVEATAGYKDEILEDHGSLSSTKRSADRGRQEGRRISPEDEGQVLSRD